MSYINDDYGEGYEPYGNNGAIEYDPHSGDPHTVTDYERQSYNIPDVVKKFLTYFRNCIIEGLIFEIQNLYESSFPKLTEQYFEKKSWPDESDVALLVDNDQVFLILYKELYCRHIYARVSGCPTLEQMFNSFSNYCDLFNYILNSDQPVPLELPDQCLWNW
jgi:translation initiation factor 3 subunit L